MLNLKQIITLLLVLYSTFTLAENETSFNKETGIATIPHVIIPNGEGDAEHFKVELKATPDGKFSVHKTDLITPNNLDNNYGQKTIKSGFYGRATTSLDKTEDTPALAVYIPRMEVSLYPREDTSVEATIPPAGATPLAKTFTDRSGFYQIEIERGSYKLCFKSSESKQLCKFSGLEHMHPANEKTKGPWQKCDFLGKSFFNNPSATNPESEVFCPSF